MALINTTTTGVLGSTFYGDGSGNLTVQQNGVTLGVFGNQPAFFAHQTSSQTISSATLTKVTLDTELFDTNSNFASSRFTPTVAGYYQISGSIAVNVSTTSGGAYIYKNGVNYTSSFNGSMNSSAVSTLMFLNGSTDYAELYVYFGTGQGMAPTLQQTFMSGVLVKAT
jgi:hypothetical protein